MTRFSRLGKVRYAFLLLLLIEVIGISGYMFFEDYSFLDSLYMTVITVATVGFKEIQPLSDSGKIFTMFLILTSMGTFLYAISVITTSIVDGEFRSYFKDFRTNSEIRKMENHVIVCGYGRNGKIAANELFAHNQSHVVIEQNHNIIAECGENSKTYFIEGDSTNDEVLIRAGIKNAKAVITTLPLDADNLFVVLSAKALNPKLTIISRATSASSERKLKIAGADKVVLPEHVGGAHMAALVLKPDVVELLRHISVYETSTVNLEEIICSEMAEIYKNKTLSELDIRSRTGANIIGFKTNKGEFIVNPLPDTKMIPDSKLFVLGTPDQIRKMKELIRAKN